MLKSAANYSNSRGRSPTEPKNLAPRPSQQKFFHSAIGARFRAGPHGRPNFPDNFDGSLNVVNSARE
jgi:hypothetical protein